MKPILIAFALAPLLVCGQGPLTPPGAPAPTQKSLQQIWDKIDELETKTQVLQAQLATTAMASALALEYEGVPLPWQSGVVAAVPHYFGESYRGTSLSFVLSPDGIPAVSWTQADSTNGFATGFGSAWTVLREFELHDADGPGGFFPSGIYFKRNSLAYASSGQAVRAGTFQAGDSGIMIRQQAGGVFTNTLAVLPAELYVDSHIELAVRADGSIILAYPHSGVTDTEIYFVHPSGSGWTQTATGITITFSNLFSMKASPAGTPTIAYVDTAGYLAIAELGPTGWNTNTVDTTLLFGDRPELAFGPDGQPAISCLTYENGLVVARRTGETWTSETIDSDFLGGGGDSSSSLAFGPSGRPAVAYTFGLGHAFRYASKDSSGGWTVSELEPSPGPGAYTGRDAILRFTRQGYPMIVYYDDATQSIRYKLRAPFAGQSQ